MSKRERAQTAAFSTDRQRAPGPQTDRRGEAWPPSTISALYQTGSTLPERRNPRGGGGGGA